MNHVIYREPLNPTHATPFWDLLIQTASYEPVTVLTETYGHTQFVESYLIQYFQLHTNSSDTDDLTPFLSRFRIITLTDYIHQFSATDRHDVAGLLNVMMHQSAQTIQTSAPISDTRYTMPGFISQLIPLFKHIHEFSISIRSFQHQFTHRFESHMATLMAIFDHTSELLNTHCPSHPMVINPPICWPKDPLFIFGFGAPTPRQKTTITGLSQDALAVSWLIPDNATATAPLDRCAVTSASIDHTIAWATTASRNNSICFRLLSSLPHHPPSPAHHYAKATSLSHAIEWTLHEVPRNQQPTIAIVIPDCKVAINTLSQLAKRHQLPLKLAQKRPLRKTPLFQSFDAIIQLLHANMAPTELENLLMAPLIHAICVDNDVPSRLNLTVLQWLNSEIDPYLNPTEWISEVMSLNDFLTPKRSNHPPDDDATPQTPFLNLPQFITHYHHIKSLKDPWRDINCTQDLLSYFKRLEHTFYLSPNTEWSPSHSLELSHYYYFWDSLTVFCDYFVSLNAISSGQAWDIPQFWAQFTQFSSHRLVTETEPHPNGIHIYHPGDFVPYSYSHVFVIDLSATIWQPSGNTNTIVPPHLHPFFQFQSESHRRQLNAYHSFRLLSQRPTVTFIHTSTALHPIPNAWVAQWDSVTLPKLTPPSPSAVSHHHDPIHFSYPRNTTLLRHQTKHTHSATSLQRYQDCPYQYFLSRVLQLPSYPQKDDTVKATIWGQFIHRFLYTFFSDVALDPTAYNRTHFFNTARKRYQTYSKNTFFWSVKHHLLFGSPTSLGMIQSLWDYLQSHPLPQTPYQFEHPFSLSLSQNKTELVITGVIDLLMKNHGDHWMSVLDYKTSANLPTSKDISDLRSLQLPIYMLATKMQYPHYQISGGLLFKIRDPNTIEYTVTCCDSDAKKTVFDVGSKRPYTFDTSFFNRIQTHLIHLKSHIDQANYSYQDFPNTNMTASYREQNVCRFCEFHMVCRYPNRFSNR